MTNEELEEILTIQPSEGRRGLEKAQAMIRRNMQRKAEKVKPGKLKKQTKVVE